LEIPQNLALYCAALEVLISKILVPVGVSGPVLLLISFLTVQILFIRYSLMNSSVVMIGLSLPFSSLLLKHSHALFKNISLTGLPVTIDNYITCIRDFIYQKFEINSKVRIKFKNIPVK